MNVRPAPGPAAAAAFRQGIAASGVVGLLGVALYYWVGALTPVTAGFVLVVLFPVYLVVAAAVLSRWLGYDRDATALRPVYRPKSVTTDVERDSRTK